MNENMGIQEVSIALYTRTLQVDWFKNIRAMNKVGVDRQGVKKEIKSNQYSKMTDIVDGGKIRVYGSTKTSRVHQEQHYPWEFQNGRVQEEIQKKSKVSDYEHYKIKTPDSIPSVPEGRETNREEDLPQLFRSEELAEKYIDNYGYPPGDFPQWGPFIDNP